MTYVDIPTGVKDGAKKKIFTEIYEAVHEAWPIPDTRVLIREWAPPELALVARTDGASNRF